MRPVFATLFTLSPRWSRYPRRLLGVVVRLTAWSLLLTFSIATLPLILLGDTKPAEHKFINNLRERPDEASSDYIQTTVVKHSEEEQFNASLQKRTRRSVTITGKTIILEKNGNNNLYETFFDGKTEDLRDVAIYAETLIIRSPVTMPQTNLTVRAKS